MKKIISLAIIGILFVSVLSASATIGERNKTNLQTKRNDIQSTSLYGDELDQFQLDQTDNYSLPVGGIYLPLDPPITLNIQVAQSFIPTKEVLTRSEIFVGKNTTASHPYVLAIREELSEENLVEASVNPDEFLVGEFSWIEFDFEDIWVTVGQTYYIVCYTENITDNWYAWAGNNLSESYQDGCAWVSIDDGDTWGNDSLPAESNVMKKQNGVAPIKGEDNTSDMCFKTYGIDGTELSIELTKTLFSVNVVVTNIGDAPAYNVEYEIIVQGGLLGFVNKTVSGTETELGVGDSLPISIGTIFGFGPISVTARAWADNAPEVSDSLDGFLMFLFIL